MNSAALVPLLKDLIALPSVNPASGGSGEGAVADYVEDFLRRAGLRPERQGVFPGRENVVARVGSEDEPAILLEAHMDTVAAEGWHDGSPFEPVERDGRIYGRGACDTKASLAVFLAVAARFAREPERLKRPLIFAATVDEETKQSGAFRLMQANWPLAGAITGEPTLLDIIHAHKGCFRIRVRTEGVAAHSAFPERGENAILRMAEVLRRLHVYAEELRRRPAHASLGRGTVNPGVIRGGQADNIVPDSCVLEVDRRLLPNETGEAVAREFQALFKCLEKVRVDEPHLVREGIETPPDHPFAAELGAAVRRWKGSCLFAAAPYMTNATAYAAAGAPSLVFGPGDIAHAHTRDEHVEAVQLEGAFAILCDLLGPA